MLEFMYVIVMANASDFLRRHNGRLVEFGDMNTAIEWAKIYAQNCEIHQCKRGQHHSFVQTIGPVTLVEGHIVGNYDTSDVNEANVVRYNGMYNYVRTKMYDNVEMANAANDPAQQHLHIGQSMAYAGILGALNDAVI